MRFLVVALIACRGNGPPRDEPSAGRPPPVAPTDARPPLTAQVAEHLDAAAARLHDPAPLVRTRAVIAKLETVRAYRDASAFSHVHGVFELVTIDRALAQLAAVEQQLAKAAQALRNGTIATAIEPLAHRIEAAYAGGVGTLPSDLVDELVFARGTCERIEDPACTEVEKIGEGYEYAAKTAREIRIALDDAVRSLRPLATDTHAQVVLDRAAGTGPSFGAACGPEDLCARDQVCEAATHTCEHACFSGAMQPCPANRRCELTDGVSGHCR